jgi:hypothetical protein
MNIPRNTIELHRNKQRAGFLYMLNNNALRIAA